MNSAFAEMSLHKLKDRPEVKSKKSMALAARDVAENLASIIEATRIAVHHRTADQGYMLDSAQRLQRHQLGMSRAHPGTVNPGQEALLEFDVFATNYENPSGRPWKRLIARQVPLYSQRGADGWGAIDLFGLTGDGRPVIIELKKDSSTETPLRALLEAAAYAISVGENWDLVSRGSEDQQRTAGLVDIIVPASTPVPIEIVVAAERLYWSEWERWSATGSGVPADTRTSLRVVAEAFAEHGISASFVMFGGHLRIGSHIGPRDLDITVIEPWA
jgi:hypothetical protein